MECDISKPIDSQALYATLVDIHAIDDTNKSFQHVIHTLFLIFSTVTEDCGILPAIIYHFTQFQILCSISIFSILLSNYRNESHPINTFLNVFIQFNMTESMDPTLFQQLLMIEILSLFCIFFFWLCVYRIVKRIAFGSKFTLISYVFSVLLPLVLMIPNLLIASRIIHRILLGANPYIWYYATTQLLTTLLLAFQIYIFAIFNTSLFNSVSNYVVVPNRTQNAPAFICVFLVGLVYDYKTPVYGKSIVAAIYFVTSFLYFAKTRLMMLVSRHEISYHLAFGFCYFYQFTIGVSSIFHKYKYLYLIHVWFTFLIYFVFYFLSRVINEWRIIKMKRRIQKASSVNDIKMSDGIRFLEYCYVMYFSDPKFLLDGSMFQYCLRTEKDPFIYISLLRILSCLPISIPYINEIEKKALSSNPINRYEQFKLFEYKIIKKQRSKLVDPDDLEYYKKMSTAIRKFFELMNSAVPVIQHIKSQYYFVFGSAISELERKIEFYVDLMMIKHPTKIMFLKLASVFYERCAMNTLKVEQIAKMMSLCNAYQEDNPLWREMNTQIVFFSQRYDLLDDSNESNCTTDSKEINCMSLKSAISNEMLRLDTKHLKVTIYLNLFAGFCFLGYIIYVIISTVNINMNINGVIQLTNAVNYKQVSFVTLMINALRPCRGAYDNAESRKDIQNFNDNYIIEHAHFVKDFISIISSSSILNTSLWEVFGGRYIESSTIDGDPFNYSYMTIGTRIASLITNVLLAPKCEDSPYYYNIQMNFLNMTDWFNQFLGKFNPALATVFNTMALNYLLWGVAAHTLLLIAGIAYIVALVVYRFRLSRINKSISEGIANKESNIMTKIISGNHKNHNFYTIIVLVLIIIMLICYGLSFLTLMSSTQNSVLTLYLALSDMFREVVQLFYIATAITTTRIEILNSTQKNMSRYAVETTMRYIMTLNRATSNNYPRIFQLSRFLGLSYYTNDSYTMLKYSDEATDMLLNDLIPEDNLYIAQRNETYQEDKLIETFTQVAFHTTVVLVTLILITIISFIMYNFVHSILYTEMITLLVPYVRTAVSEDGSNSVSGMNENSFTLDLIGYPAAVIDENDEIIFVNHLWLTAFNGVMQNFIGENYKIIKEVEFNIHPYVLDGMRVAVVERSREMTTLREAIAAKDKEYQSMIQVLHPLESFSNAMKERDAVILSLVFTSFIEGDKMSEVDSCSYEVRSIMSQLKEFAKDYQPRFLTWSFGELQIVFGICEETEPLIQAAIAALNTAFFAIQKALELEEMFELNIAAVIMQGKFADCIFDGKEARLHRQPNAIIISPAISDLLTDYICDIAFVVNGFITIYVDVRDIKLVEEEEEDLDLDGMYIVCDN